MVVKERTLLFIVYAFERAFRFDTMCFRSGNVLNFPNVKHIGQIAIKVKQTSSRQASRE